ncbi:hypothetical protein [Streptomyces colonosanans]|uniref:hypothetical protein n=1 Tax=Streptomyces colonosanans TaxID=1428652 RepID=UPI00115FE8B5|nr:hypothetical protein [Streptomyces colonosanans]
MAGCQNFGALNALVRASGVELARGHRVIWGEFEDFNTVAVEEAMHGGAGAELMFLRAVLVPAGTHRTGHRESDGGYDEVQVFGEDGGFYGRSGRGVAGRNLVQSEGIRNCVPF